MSIHKLTAGSGYDYLTRQVAAQHRFLGFFRLKEQRVLVVSPEHQQNPGACADAADPDHPSGHVDIAEVLHQVPPVGLQSAPVGPDDAANLPFDLQRAFGTSFLRDGRHARPSGVRRCGRSVEA